jgi:putative endonuclease
MIFESKMAYMYILVCANGGLYVGSTHSLDKRIAEHNAGEGANYTKKNLPVKLVFAEKHTSISSAFRREQQVKKWSRKKKIALIENNQEELIELAKKKQNSNKQSNKIQKES